jgi:hypothetical protein
LIGGAALQDEFSITIAAFHTAFITQIEINPGMPKGAAAIA